jgi:hypothetical protein
MYGPKPVPLKVFLWGEFFGDRSSGLVQRDRLRGFARRFRPTYAGANVGHPSRERGLRLTKGSRFLPKLPALKTRSINEYLCDALH